MSCPFYGCSLVSLDRGHGRVGPPAFVNLNAGNQCALITSAHSPCWMEVAEQSAPEWAACPRNPEWITEAFRSEAAMARWNSHATYLDVMRTARTIELAKDAPR